MAVNLGFVAFSFLGGALLVLILVLISRVRPWHYPVRGVSFDFGDRTRSELLDRGPSGETEADFEEEEAEEPESWWERTKMGLYTYQKRPSKVR